MKSFINFIFDLVRNRKLILQLVSRDLKNRYLGSYLGIIWAFIQPLITLLVLWFVFQVGFRSKPVGDLPFILWLMTGFIPWIFISDGLLSATNSVIEYSFLVKKVVFRVSLLPIVKILAALIIHVFFVGMIVLVFSMYGYYPSIYNFQVIYYSFAAIVMLLGLSWITSSLVVFLRDIGQVIAVIIQFGFWGTPIFWSINMLPSRLKPILKLNPAYYIVEGYRDAFINKIWFWEHLNLTIYYWTIALIAFIGGALIFKRLRPHFADVL